jgi:hypothetical protein
MHLGPKLEERRRGAHADDARNREVIDLHGLCERGAEDQQRRGMHSGVGVAADERGPGDDVPLRHFVEQAAGVRKVAALGVHVENGRSDEDVASERRLGGKAVEGMRGERRARRVRGGCDGLGGGGDGAVGGWDPGREHAAEGVEGGGGEAVLGEGGYEGGPRGGGRRGGEVEEGAEGELRERAAGVEGEEVVGE